ncbi:hypothetical protein PAAG_07122 [Paracoccidioides lutzii Pb01]|uniref:Uncharacterized protein n=1 Tax=Paracoccidioides lutzii (strain ATCC MYA-826 / Pb01) TaxID=502779 RepID=C1H8N1_PARBA|nr:hypothetical protein PAAG_07122 [Paracoccidioides lutzii Pb01]EEH36704.2 hypothetical protein PAAG_07122 [Paracoccidioides lutzii Pb01]
MALPTLEILLTMEDAVRPSAEKLTEVYDKGYCTWLNLFLHATQEPRLPQAGFQIQSSILHQPYFPRHLDLKHNYGNLSVTGTSIWEVSQEPCKIPALEKQIPPLEKQLDIPILIPGPTHLTLSSCSDPRYHNWFKGEESHLSVLILAWSYILSARWADLMPWSPVLEYTDSQAQWKDDQPADRDSVMVEIGNVDNSEARWWAAILAPGEGWQAYISSGKDKFRSPWSITFDSSSRFTLSHYKCCPALLSRAVPFETAICLLSDYCELHDVVDQSHAALSAVLFLPYLHGMGKDVFLPRPRFFCGTQLKSVSQPGVQPNRVCLQINHGLDRLQEP